MSRSVRLHGGNGRSLPDGELTQDWSGYHAQASTIDNWGQFAPLVWQCKCSFVTAAAIAPNLDRPPFYCDFPFAYTDTKPRKVVKIEEVYDKFPEHSILKLAENHLDALLSMRAIYIDHGTNDVYLPIKEARTVHEKLESLGVKHVYNEFPGGHSDHVMTSTGDALEVFSNAMAFEVVVGVEPAGRLAATWGQIKVARQKLYILDHGLASN